MGHSILAAYNSDPNHPNVDARANSWATGSNPQVNSIYQRILGVHPKIGGRNLNLARDGASVTDLLLEARQLARSKARRQRELVVIQIMDNDIRCDGTDKSNFRPFGATFARVLRTVANALPDARIFVISQIGTSSELADALGSTPESRARFTGTGLCDFFDPSGQRNEAHIAYLDAVTAGYEHQLITVCRSFVHCRYGDMHGYVDHLVDLSPDLNHFAISGLARLAGLAWTKMFDFTDRTAPVSVASVTKTRSGKRVAIKARDAAGLSGIEFEVVHRGARPGGSFQRYRNPIRIRRGATLIWRAVDVNGNTEATHNVHG
jgi:hypothetical protein